MANKFSVRGFGEASQNNGPNSRSFQQPKV
jgi:hypothetical protein